MRRQLPADDQVTAVMERVLAEAAENGRKATVTAVDLAASPGMVVGLLGPNGAGKTTVVRVLGVARRGGH